MNLSFAHPSLLWGSLLVGVPLIIHLLNRRRYRTVRWAAQRFLLEAYRKTRRRLTLESLLLLLLRCLAVLLLALALARPFVPAESALSVLSPQRRSVVLVFDTSYSMGRVLKGGVTCMDRARVQALRVLDGLSHDRGDEVTVVALADAPRTLQSATTEFDRAREVIERLEPDHGGADLVRTMDYLMENVLGSGRKEVYVFSDLQARTFAPGGVTAGSGEALPASSLRVARAAGAELVVVDVGDADPPRDLVVEDLVLHPETAVAGDVVRFSASVRNLSPEPAHAVTGTFVFDEDSERPKVVTFEVAAGGVTTVETSRVFHDEGARRASHVVRFSLEPDDLAADDERVLAFPVVDAVRVLLVDGDAGVPEPERGAQVLADMFDPSPDPESRASVYRVTLVDERRFNLRAEDLTAYELIVLSNVSRIDAQVARELADAVRAGRGLLVFLGDRVDPRSYNERLLGEGLLPARVLEPRGSPDPDADAVFFPASVDFVHPLLRLFSDPLLRPNLLGIPVRRFWRCDPVAEGARVVAALDDDPASPGPLFVVGSAGRGRVVLVTTSADASWAGFALNDNVVTFLPLIQETASFLTREDPSDSNLTVGDAIRRSSRTIPEAMRVVLPDARVVDLTDPPREREFGEFLLPPFEDTALPGVYRLELDYPLTGAGGDAGRRVVEKIAVNVDPAESDPARVEPEAFETLFPGAGIEVVSQIPGPKARAGAGREGDLWRFGLWLAVSFLAAESLLGWWIGRSHERVAA